MKLVINSPGIYLTKYGECFRIKKDEDKTDIAAKKVEQILITTATALSTDALELAVENNIDVLFLKSNGSPFGRVWHSKLGSVATIRRKQLLLNEHPLGTKLVKEWVEEKLNNQGTFLKELASNRRDERQACIQEAIEIVQKAQSKIENLDNSQAIEDLRPSIQGFEGSAGRAYFKAIGQLIPKKYHFDGRSRNPAEDEFNCLLNYGYGIMYGNVERACILAGLDPYIGIMHADNYNRKALTFDLIEPYRIYIDKIVFKLFSNKQVKAEQFDQVEGGYFLNKTGKELLLAAYNKEMEKKIKHRGKNIELQNMIQYDCHTIANTILKEV